MIQADLYIYIIYETWRIRTGSTFISGHMIIFHGKEKKKGHVMAGMAIIIELALVTARKQAGAMPAMTSLEKYRFSGRMLGVLLSFLNIWSHHGKTHLISDHINIFLASIYHPVDLEEQVHFNSELLNFYDRMPRNAEIIPGREREHWCDIQTL